MRSIPLDADLVHHLPAPGKRPFTAVEALFLLQLSFEMGTPVSMAGLASRMGWSRAKLSRFMESAGVCLTYGEDTRRKQKQFGLLSLIPGGEKKTETGQIKVLMVNEKPEEKDRNETEEKPAKGRRKKKAQASILSEIDETSEPVRMALTLIQNVKEEYRIRNDRPHRFEKEDVDDKKRIARVRASALALERLIRIDKARISDVWKVIDFVRYDDFWYANVQAGDKLREQYPRLLDQALRKGPRGRPGKDPRDGGMKSVMEGVEC